MNITIVVPYVGNFGQKGFYNSQEIGLSKVLAKHGYIVSIVRLHDKKMNSKTSITEISNNINFISIPSKKIGTHGVFDLNYLYELNTDIIIIFSDIQMFVPKIHTWAKKTNIRVIDYVGVLHSNSHKSYIRLFSNIISARNINHFRQSTVFAKTPAVFNELKLRGVNNINLMHVGLDLDLMKIDFNTYDKQNLRDQFELDKIDIVIAFIGRLENDKKPLELILLFKYLISRDNRFRLLIVGTGKLKSEMKNLIVKLNLTKYIKHFEKLPNDEIWKIYYCSDLYLNLCENEIFGMCILEAMYYECPVLAVSAPGPDFIIENNKNGLLISNLNETQCFRSIKRLLNDSFRIASNAKQKVMNEFVWENSASSLLSELKYSQKKGKGLIMKKCNILGVNVDVTNVKETIRYITDNLSSEKGNYVCVSNVHTTVMAYEDEQYRKIQNEAFMTLPDGKPLSILSKFKGFKEAERVTGPDLMEDIFRISQEHGYSHFFYGSTEETLQLIKKNLNRKFPNLKIYGTYSPPFRKLTKEEDEKIILTINDVKADFLWVGLGAPKQEIWMYNHKNKIESLMLGVGAAFDYFAGKIKRAPKWMQLLSLEWVFRLIQQPKQLIKRYTVTNSKFIYYLMLNKRL